MNGTVSFLSVPVSMVLFCSVGSFFLICIYPGIIKASFLFF